MAGELIVALEVGTTRTVALIAENDVRTGARTVIGLGVENTSGIRKSQIFDRDLALPGITKAIRRAASASNVDIKNVLLGMSGGHIDSLISNGHVLIQNRDKTITLHDVEDVEEIAKNAKIDDTRCVLHTLRQNYSIDGQDGIFKPEGMCGSDLTVNMLIVHGERTRIDNITQLVRSADLDIQDTAFSGLCASMAVVSPEQKHNGVLVIDLGGGTTDYTVHVDNVVATAGSLAVGGDHVDNDLASAFDISMADAENFKIKHGSAIMDPDTGLQRVDLPPRAGIGERSASLRAVHTVINARLAETLELIKERVNNEGLLQYLRSGIILTGGGAYMRGIKDLTQNVFGNSCSIGVIRYLDGLRDVEQPASYASAAGLALYGFLSYEEERAPKSFLNLFKRR